jgi:CBS domain-containing protein
MKSISRLQLTLAFLKLIATTLNWIHRERRVMNPIAVSPSLDLHHWVEDFVYRYYHHTFPVATDGRLLGVITTRALSQMPREKWAGHTVGEVMASDLRPLTIAADADAMEALTKMQRTGSTLLVVTEGDRLLGIVSLKDLLRFLNLKLELEGQNEAFPQHGDSRGRRTRDGALARH